MYSLDVINMYKEWMFWALSTKRITFWPGAMNLWQSATSSGQLARTIAVADLKSPSMTWEQWQNSLTWEPLSVKHLLRVLEGLPPGFATINWSGLLILNALQQVQFLRLFRGGIATSQRGKMRKKNAYIFCQQFQYW